MVDKKSKIVLDDEANKLYQMLGGIDTGYHTPSSNDYDGFIHSLEQEEEIQNRWLITLTELASHLASFLKAAPLSKKPDSDNDGIKIIINQITKICSLPGNTRMVHVRFRGWRIAADQEASSDQFDYTVESDNALLDLAAINDLVNQSDKEDPQLPGQLLKAFMDFADLNINSIYINIGKWTPEDAANTQDSLKAFGLFYNTLAKINTDDCTDKTATGTLVCNEHKQFDPNLTTLAKLNKLNPEALQKLVFQVKDMMVQEKTRGKLQHCLCVYDAIFAFKKFQEQLKKPTVEINNIRWLLEQRQNTPITQGKIHISQALTEIFKNSPKKVAQVIENIYGCDYRDIKASHLKQNLETLSELVGDFDKASLYADARLETIKRIQYALDQVSGDVLADLHTPIETPRTSPIETPEEQVANATSSSQDTSIFSLIHSEIVELLSFFLKRSKVRKKIKNIISQESSFNELDLLIIAKDFGIEPQEARRLVILLGECFTAKGKFNRRIFEKNIPELLKSEKKVFGFLWHYLKVIKYRDDRVAFLNSLQLFIAKMVRPQDALDVLLLDFSHDPKNVNYSDRNALILSNILIRNYNKELNNHIELTPEEVLMVKEGLNEKMTTSASKSIDTDSARFFEKTKSLHSKLIASLTASEGSDTPIEISYVVNVERELFIHLSLVGCTTGHKIIQSAVKEYGNPNSKIYTLLKTKEQMKAIFGLLQVAVRALGRFNYVQDLNLLKEVFSKKDEFIKLQFEHQTQNMVNRVMDYVHLTMENISTTGR